MTTALSCYKERKKEEKKIYMIEINRKRKKIKII
jgi:hypothetical protein